MKNKEVDGDLIALSYLLNRCKVTAEFWSFLSRETSYNWT